MLSSFDISEAGVDQMGFSIFLNFHDGTHETLDHGFVVNEASIHARVPCALLMAVLRLLAPVVIVTHFVSNLK